MEPLRLLFERSRDSREVQLISPSMVPVSAFPARKRLRKLELLGQRFLEISPCSKLLESTRNSRFVRWVVEMLSGPDSWLLDTSKICSWCNRFNSSGPSVASSHLTGEVLYRSTGNRRGQGFEDRCSCRELAFRKRPSSGGMKPESEFE
ncbi:hypothetical protein FCM35_KLT06128 [Carex littledalei]|uniref:Uncharacterized protein n=1 Tax=Carex littledalei TaxID=544730 RepID=A0A833QM81_9POAL|nr:hypothetical protein FCM35_KLT06128 [Carex littledalei]